jgi:hypothetical protein
MVFEIMVKIILAGNSNSEVEVLGKVLVVLTYDKAPKLLLGF